RSQNVALGIEGQAGDVEDVEIVTFQGSPHVASALYVPELDLTPQVASGEQLPVRIESEHVEARNRVLQLTKESPGVGSPEAAASIRAIACIIAGRHDSSVRAQSETAER